MSRSSRTRPASTSPAADSGDHKAFGGGGRHFCLGAGLARQELKVLFEELARRMPDIEQAGAAERLPSNWANGLTSLPVRFSPGARQA